MKGRAAGAARELSAGSEVDLEVCLTGVACDLSQWGSPLIAARERNGVSLTTASSPVCRACTMRGPDSNRVRFCNTLMSRSLGRAPRARAGLRGRRSGTRRPGSSPVDVPAEPLRVRADGRFSSRYLDTDAVKVIRRLNAHGFTAYLVGGCVRDVWSSYQPSRFSNHLYTSWWTSVRSFLGRANILTREEPTF